MCGELVKKKKFKTVTFRVEAKTAAQYARCSKACDMDVSKFIRLTVSLGCEHVELMITEKRKKELEGLA